MFRSLATPRLSRVLPRSPAGRSSGLSQAFCKTYLSPKRGCDRFRELGKEHGVRRTNPTAEDPAAQMPPLMSRARPRIVFNAPLSSLLIGGLCCYPVGAAGHSVTCWAFAPRPALCTRTEQTLFLMAVIFFQLGTPPFS